MEFLARSDDRIERLRSEPMAALDQGRHILIGTLDLSVEPDPLLDDQLVDFEAELARRVKETQAMTTAHVPKRGNPVARDFDGVTDRELERERGDLAVSAGLAARGSAVHVAIVNRIGAIDCELSRRAEQRGQ